MGIKLHIPGFMMFDGGPLRFKDQRPIHIELTNATGVLISHCQYSLHPVDGKLIIDGVERDRYGHYER